MVPMPAALPVVTAAHGLPSTAVLFPTLPIADCDGWTRARRERRRRSGAAMIIAARRAPLGACVSRRRRVGCGHLCRRLSAPRSFDAGGASAAEATGLNAQPSRAEPCTAFGGCKVHPMCGWESYHDGIVHYCKSTVADFAVFRDSKTGGSPDCNHDEAALILVPFEHHLP